MVIACLHCTLSREVKDKFLDPTVRVSFGFTRWQYFHSFIHSIHSPVNAKSLPFPCRLQ